jgi:pre-mRNA 3'-end-processing factor FIP1
MEDDEDDLYAENSPPPSDPTLSNAPTHQPDDDEASEDMDEYDSESDSDVDIITERPEGEPTQPFVVPSFISQPLSCTANLASRTTQLPGIQLVQRPEGGASSAAIPIVAPPPPDTAAAYAASAASKPDSSSQPRPQITVQSGLSFPAVRSSTVDVKATPIYTPLGKPITEVEIDSDLIEHEKPWRRPGATQSDYFNYGFDEFTWSTYCLRQRTMAEGIKEQKNENSQFEMMFGGGMMGGGMPAADPMAAMGGMGAMAAMGPMGGMGAMGMSDQQSFQVAMMEAMQQQGVSDPSKVNFDAFMSQMQGGGMGQQGVPSGPSVQQQQQNYAGGNWQNRGGGGYGRGKRGQRW